MHESQNKIFAKLFGEAELAKLEPVEKIAYKESLKVYRDLKAVTDTAYDDGYKEAESIFIMQIEEEKRKVEEEKRKLEEEKRKVEELIKALLETKSIEEISNLLNISKDDILTIILNSKNGK